MPRILPSACSLLTNTSPLFLRSSNSLLLSYTNAVSLSQHKPQDLYRACLIFGTAVFLLGSIFSGAAQSMEQLIIFRAVQGLGAGAVLPIVLTIIGNIFELQERARVQGFFSAVWGLSSGEPTGPQDTLEVTGISASGVNVVIHV